MLTVALLLFGSVLLVLTLADRMVRRLPMSPAVIYLVAGWLAGAVLGAPSAAQLQAHAPLLVIVTELAVLCSLFAVGLRLRVPPTLRLWRVALLLAGPVMVLTVAFGAVAGVLLLGLPWAAAVLLASVLAPTDPVLASEVQIRGDEDRDSVRLSLTAEGGLNDGVALPAVMLALGWMGLHELGTLGRDWWLYDLLWPIGGGGLLGLALGRGLGHLLQARIVRADRIAREELLYVAVVALAYGLARITSTSTFVVMFAAGASLLWPFRGAALEQGGQALSDRLCSFGASLERLLEAATVLVVGVALHSAPPTWRGVAFGVAFVVLVRPLSVLAIVWPGRPPGTQGGHGTGRVTRHQRRLVAWFGIRGIGTLFYLAFVMEHGVTGSLAEEMLSAGLTAVALSIVLHGVSATPLMTAYQQRRKAPPAKPPA